MEKKNYYANLFLHVPHSSSAFPEESKYSWKDLNDEERLLIDYYTDELFVPKQKAEHIESAVFTYCRLYCDVERLINDPLEKEGLGICYTRLVPIKEGYTCRSFSTSQEAFEQYVDFHAMVSKKFFSMGDNTLLIDCHSFSNKPNLLCSNPPDIDVCVGYNDDDTKPDKKVIEIIVTHFKACCYKVAINEPFSNSKTFNVPLKYHTVMIEVNKRLYMDEYSLMKNEGFEKIKQDIQSLYDILLYH